MAALSHGARQAARSLHVPARPPSTAQRFVSETRSFLSRLVSHLATPVPHPPPIRQTLPHSQTIHARFSLPVQHAFSRPFSAPRLPRPPVVPANVSHVGLGTARAFHSGRPIFQNMVDNVPIATRALWEAEWDIKTKKKEARRMRRATQNKVVQKSQEMLKPRPTPVVLGPQSDASELDVYFPVEPVPPVTTHLLVPLPPTPTARLPLSTRADGGGAHPLLPISQLAYIHTSHQKHSLRVSTLFSRLDAANVWGDPGVNVDAYAFGPRHDAQERQCTILRVTFNGWSVGRVRAILGDSTDEWYSLEETDLNGRPPSVPVLDLTQDVDDSRVESELSLPDSVELVSSSASEVGTGGHDTLPPIQDLVMPTLDFSSAFSDAAANLSPSSQPAVLLHNDSRSTHDIGLVSPPSLSLSFADPPPTEDSWECLGLSSSFLQRVGEHRQGEVLKNV